MLVVFAVEDSDCEELESDPVQAVLLWMFLKYLVTHTHTQIVATDSLSAFSASTHQHIIQSHAAGSCGTKSRARQQFLFNLLILFLILSDVLTFYFALPPLF